MEDNTEMALTRKYLKALDIDDAKIDQIIEAHTEVTDALKADRDKYKDEAKKAEDIQNELDDVTRERDDLKKKADEYESYKEKYEKEHKAFDDYKKGVDADKAKAKKADAYKSLLKEAGVSEKRFDAIMRLTSLDDITLDENGKVKDSEKVVEGIKSEWSEYIVKTQTKGADTQKPPANNHGDKKMTIAEIDAIEDTSARQKAMAENHELYGI